MAGGAAGGGSSGNKLDTEVNLVPFIDLLSSLVLFLLLTVVWVQVAAIPASVDSRGKSATSEADQSKVLVHVTRAGFQLTWPPKLIARGLPASVGGADALARVFRELGRAADAPPASVSGEDGVEYGMVVEALDALKGAGISNVALNAE